MSKIKCLGGIGNLVGGGGGSNSGGRQFHGGGSFGGGANMTDTEIWATGGKI